MNTWKQGLILGAIIGSLGTFVGMRVYPAIYPYFFPSEIKTLSHQEKADSLEIELSFIDPMVNIFKVEGIESAGKSNSVSSAGARGLYQIMEPTWNECVKRLGVDWSFDDAFDREKSRSVARFYINKRIPEMLKAYKISDSQHTRLAAYIWGIGNLKKTYKKHGNKWEKYAPLHVTLYLQKYDV